MYFKKFVYLCSVVILLLFTLTSCTIAYSFPFFDAETNELDSVSLSNILPDELSSYSEWDRAEKWIKIAETDNPRTKIYANKVDTDKLFLQADENFYELEWENARSLESEINLYTADVDSDGTNEVIAVLCLNGGTHWYKEELHIIDREGKELFDITFPIEEYEKWITDNAILTASGIKFFESSVNIDITSESKLADTISLVHAFVTDKKISVSIFIDDDKQLPLASITTVFSYDNNKLFTVQDFSIAKADQYDITAIE